MKYILKIILWGWLAFWCFFGLVMLSQTSNQIKKDQRFFQMELERPVQYIKEYLHNCGTFPPQSNFPGLISETRQIPNELRNQIDSLPRNGWIYCVWKEDWIDYYVSWKDEYIRSRWTWSDAITQFIGMGIIGIFPIGTYSLLKQLMAYFNARRVSE
jgi:hypothetical protein